MKSLAVAALVFFASIAAAQDIKPIAIAVEPLGDTDHGVAARVTFRFANPREITDAGLFLEGSFAQSGRPPRNFRIAVIRDGDRVIFNDVRTRNGVVLKQTRYAVLPDRGNEMSAIFTFDEGPLEVNAWLVLELDREGAGGMMFGSGSKTVTLAKLGHRYVEEKPVAEPVEDEPQGAVVIRAPKRNGLSSLYHFAVDVLPPVTRVEFWVNDRKIIARRGAPYAAELDLGERDATVRAIGFDAAGRYVDADAFALDDTLTVKLTRVATAEGQTHFKVSVHNPQTAKLKSVALFAGERKLHEWTRPPYAVSVPTDSLRDAGYVRAVIVDDAGQEVADRVELTGG